MVREFGYLRLDLKEWVRLPIRRCHISQHVICKRSKIKIWKNKADARTLTMKFRNNENSQYTFIHISGLHFGKEESTDGHPLLTKC